MRKSIKIQREVDKTKTKLINKAKKKGLWENFGQNEVRDIKDKYDYSSMLYGTTSLEVSEEQTCVRIIENFYHWCLNFDLSHLK
jgi:hypothetical protein